LEKSVVLEVIFYQTIEELKKNDSKSVAPLIICPSPVIADGLRRFMLKESEIITISKWVTDYLKINGQKRMSKAELMLRLSSVWRHYYPEEESHYFFNAFEIFTDLRSYTLSLDLLSEFVKELDEITTKSIFIFWSFLENEKIIDEHKSYQILSSLKTSKPIWIFGFKHLSGIQIDMLKLLGEKNNVRVFFPKEVYLETISSDWIRWLVPSEQLSIQAARRRVKIIYYPKNKLNITLKSLQKKIAHYDLALASNHSTFNSRQEVMTEDQFLKSPEDLFKVSRDKFLEKIQNKLQDESLSFSMVIKDFLLSLEDYKKESILSEDFILYKTILIFENALNLYSEFQSTIDLFTLKVIKVILELNSPRVFLATICPNPKSRLLEINELIFSDSKDPLVLVATSHYGALKSGESKYSEKMLEALKAIAPMKRAGLDFAYLKSELVQILENTNNILLMEEGLELIDLTWREILKGFDLERVETNTDYIIKGKNDYLAPKIKNELYLPKHFSASRIQTYMDCPRKYYFTYIDRLENRPEERLKIASDEMGTLEHEIIERYFAAGVPSAKDYFNPTVHRDLCQFVLEDFLTKRKIRLSSKAKLVAFYELIHYSQNGIEFLLNFLVSNKAIDVTFETPVGNNPLGIVGSIDCLITLPENQIAIFDFKRSAAAIGSKKETLAFEKIQIWIYLILQVRYHSKNIHTWGYLNLSEIEASLIFKELESVTLNDFYIEEFKNFLLELIGKINKEEKFKAAPRNNKICHFCEVSLLCDKGSCSQ